MADDKLFEFDKIVGTTKFNFSYMSSVDFS